MSWTLFNAFWSKVARFAVRRNLRFLGMAIATGIIWGSWSIDDQNCTPYASANSARPLQLRPAGGDQPISLRDRLIVGLQARLDSEIAFIELIVHMVNRGEIPQRMVDETFFWARSRAARVQYGRTRRGIIYFRPAMTARLERLGLRVR